MSDNNITPSALGQRIIIIGTTGAGKTRLATELSRLLNRSHIELDALYWEPNWQEAALAVFRERVIHALQGDT